MNKLISLSILMLLYSCQEKSKENVSNELNSKTASPDSVRLDNNYPQKSDTINYTNANGIKEGRWIEFKSGVNSPKVKEGNYLDNKKTGIWTEYYNNGAIKNKTTYKNNRPDGYVIIYDNNGKISKEGNYENGIFLEK